MRYRRREPANVCATARRATPRASSQGYGHRRLVKITTAPRSKPLHRDPTRICYGWSRPSRPYRVTNIATTAAPITTVASQPNQRNRLPMVKRPIAR